jgi:phosphoglycolate phosphatase-like HAD superfamily hydrolase
VIGMGLMQALAHAAPDVPPERYPLLGERYRHYWLAQQHEISLFDGVLPLLADLRARHHWLAVATGKSRRGLDEALRSVELHGSLRWFAHRRRDRRQARVRRCCTNSCANSVSNPSAPS